MPGVPSIVIADDASEVRLLIRTRLRLSGRFEVVGEAADGVEAVEQARRHQPMLMLLDVSMPRMDGLAALPQVLAASPDTRVVLFSGFEEQGLVEQAEALGAAGFVEKSATMELLLQRLTDALRHAHPGPAEAGPPAARGPQPAPRPAYEQGAPLTGDQHVLDEHLERFREVFDEAAIGMATMTLTGTLVRGNRALAKLVERPIQELVGLFYGELTDGRGDEVTAALDEVRRNPVDVVRLEHGTSSAEGRTLLATLAPVRDFLGRPLYVFVQVQDVTAERAAVEALRRSEERFRLLVEVVEDYAIFMLDPDGRIASWNAGAQRSKGYTADEIIGQHFRVFYPPEVAASKHPERELEIAVREGRYSEEGWRVRKDGSRFFAYVVITAVFDEHGHHLGFAKVTRDITDRRQLEQEREQAAAELAHANRELELLNDRLRQTAEDQAQFLAVTAHELRTPVGVLGSSADMLAQHWTQLEGGERGELLDAMATSTVRLRRLLDDLLTASRLQSSALAMRFREVEVRDVVDAAVATVRRTSPMAEVVVDVPGGAAVTGDPDRLAQAVENLVTNALRHGAPPVHVTMTMTGEQLQLRVRDAGTGVASPIRPRLFERFATGAGKDGTGLGLFIVRELARVHGGDAFYEPDPDGAAGPSPGTFVIALPRASANAAPAGRQSQ